MWASLNMSKLVNIHFSISPRLNWNSPLSSIPLCTDVHECTSTDLSATAQLAAIVSEDMSNIKLYQLLTPVSGCVRGRENERVASPSTPFLFKALNDDGPVWNEDDKQHEWSARVKTVKEKVRR